MEVVARVHITAMTCPHASERFIPYAEVVHLGFIADVRAAESKPNEGYPLNSLCLRYHRTYAGKRARPVRGQHNHSKHIGHPWPFYMV